MMKPCEECKQPFEATASWHSICKRCYSARKIRERESSGTALEIKVKGLNEYIDKLIACNTQLTAEIVRLGGDPPPW